MLCPQKLRSLCVVVVASILITACQTETLVTKVDPTKPHTQTTDGILFSLPETVLVTEVPVTRVASSPGTYHEWTWFFYPELTADDYVTEEGIAFKIGTPTFTTRGQTDPNNVYIAHIKAKAFETKTLLLEFNDDGIIARTEASSKDESIDIITSGIKTVASFVAPLSSGASPFRIGIENVENQVQTEENVRICDKRAQEFAAAKAAAVKAKADAAKNLHSKQLEANAETLQNAADAAARALAKCHEDEFRSELSPSDLALYDSLEDSYRRFLRENLGFDFLLFLLRKQSDQAKSANIEFFLTLGLDQQKIIKEMEPRSTSPCVEAPPATRCLALSRKLELVRAKAVYDKIQDLRSHMSRFWGKRRLRT